MTGRRAPLRRLAAVAACVAAWALSGAGGSVFGPQEPVPFGLSDLFAAGLGGRAGPGLLLDENADGVPDRLGAAFVTPAAPTLAERAAAAEVAARLGFETMALDLPLARGPVSGRVGIVIGRRALAEAGLAAGEFGAAGLAAGEGVVAVAETVSPRRRWLAVLGADEEGLLRAARLLAGALPHVGDLSGPSLAEVAGELAAGPGPDSLDALGGSPGEREGGAGASPAQPPETVSGPASPPRDDASPAAPVVVFTRAVAEAGGNIRLSGFLHPGEAGEETAQERFAALQELAAARAAGPAAAPDSGGLRFKRLTSVALAYQDGEVVLPTLAETPPGPVPSRPGASAKKSMDLSNLYTADGFLGDSDGDEIPDRTDAVLAPSGDARIVGLAARIGLESAGLVVPLVLLPSELPPPARRPTTVLVGAGPAHPLVSELADSGLVAPSALPPGHGLVELVPKAFGAKPSLVVSGPDSAGAALAARRVAEVFPHVAARGGGTPVFDDLERDLWAFLSGRAPAGQAALALYKLDRIAAGLADQDLASAHVLVSLEKPAPGFADAVAARAAALGADETTVHVDDRDVQRAALVFEDEFEVPSEVDRFWAAFEARVLAAAEPGARVDIEARLSEPPAVRREIAAEAERRLRVAGAAPESRVVVLSAFKQGLSWLRESVAPRLQGRAVGEIVIEFLRNDPPPEWPQQAIHTPVRWLHEIFPADEVLAADLGIRPAQVRFEMTAPAEPAVPARATLPGAPAPVDPPLAASARPPRPSPVYRVRAFDPAGELLLEDAFDPAWVLRPYFDRFRDYEQVRVTTGWIRAVSGADTLADERIVTDPEWFWDRFQARTLPAVYDYVMDRHDGNPRGGGLDAPLFGELEVELELSEPDYRLGVDNEIISPMDALHEEIYFGAIEFFHLIGRNARGRELTYPGRILPRVTPRSDGGPGRGRITFTGFATGRPAVVVRYRTRDGAAGERRLDIPKIAMERPSLRRAEIAPDAPALRTLAFQVRVDSERDERESLLVRAPPEQVDERMISAEQAAAVLANLAELRASGLYAHALAYDQVGEIGVWAEWTHDQDPESRTTATLPANGVPAAQPSWTALVPAGWSYDGSRIVQWDTPIPPGEGDQMMAKMARAFDHAVMYRAGESYLGRTIWAMDLTAPVAASHWSRTKATTFKPTVLYSARQHANEVSSTSHVLRHAELLLTDSAQRRKLDKVNVVVHAFANPDGAQLAYDLYRATPDYILHAGYLGSLGVDMTAEANEDFPIYPEAQVRGRLWRSWLPDVFLNPHGYPSHQVVQLFSEYSGLVRRGRVTERNWGLNKGWFMPGFGYVDDPELPRHKEAAFRLRDYITAAINANRDVFELNQRSYARYRRYGAAFDPEVFRLPMTDSVLIEMPLKGSRAGGGGRGFNPKVTIWSGVTEAPDETAYGDWLHLVAKAGLSWDQAVLDYLYEGNHQMERSGSEFFGGRTLKTTRPRPPKTPS